MSNFLKKAMVITCMKRERKGAEARALHNFISHFFLVFWNNFLETEKYTSFHFHCHLKTEDWGSFLVWFGLVYDYGLWSEDPSRDCLMAPYQSASTSIGLTSGWGYPLKNLPYSCKYSAGEALKVWGARGAITIAEWRKAPIYQIIWRVLHL